MPVSLSFWEKEAFFQDIDVMVIGSGIVGLHAAIALKEKQADLRVVVIERGSLPAGASTRNAGFACFGSMTELLDDLSSGEEDAVWALVEKRWRGLQNLRQRLGDQAIDFCPWGGYELFREEESAVHLACLDQMAYFNQQLEGIIGEKSVFEQADQRLGELGFAGIPHLIYNKAEGQLHTGKMMARLLALAQSMGISIYNGMEVSGIKEEQGGVSIEMAEGWVLRAHKIIVATNGLTRRLLPDLAVNPARNQVLITKPISGLKIKGTFHYDRGFFYFRNVENRLLLGGGRCLDLRGEETDEFGLTPKIQGALLDLLRSTILPNQAFVIEQWWSGIMGIGDKKVPIVKQLGNHITVAVRLGGMGVAIGALVGEEAAQLVIDG
ncbi:MAG: FAD-dependent oxidoreductase [Saprospiraceae bacterium]